MLCSSCLSWVQEQRNAEGTSSFVPQTGQNTPVLKWVQDWGRSELRSTTFFLALQQTPVWSVWALTIDCCSTGTTERLHTDSDGALVQPLICTRFFPCCASPLGNSLSFLNRNCSWLQNKNVWS